MPKIACPTCETMLDIEESMIGKQMRCGSCECLFEATLPKKTKKKKTKSKHRDDDDDDDDDDFEESSRNDYLDDKPKPKGMAITSMILGLIAIVSAVMGLILGFMGVGCCCFSFISWPFVGLSSVLSVGGLIFGLVSMKGDGKPFWLTGIITSGIALILSLVIIVLSVLGIGLMTYKASNYTPPTYTFPTYPAYVPPTYSTPTFPAQPKKIVTSPGNFKVVLVSFDNMKRVDVLQVLLDAVGMRLSEASRILVQKDLPKDVIKDIDKKSADTIKKLLDAAGAKATVE